jgi:RNA polymerase-interacting CarD/CdnL/TRCF family regulator
MMNFRKGDMVMHCTYGLGEVINLEERALSGSKILYYGVHAQDLTVWVPADSKVTSRLRFPTPKLRFKRLLTILSEPSDPLPADRLERKARLLALLNHGSVESLCKVIRDLSAHEKVERLNDNDTMVLKQARRTLLGEWEFVLSVSHAQANLELYRLLASGR